jgi:hypothetical protein
MTYQEFEEKRWGKGDLIVFRKYRRKVIGVNFESGWIQTRTRYSRRKIWVYYGDCETVPSGAQNEER